MNRLPFEKRRQILHLMVEGNGINAIERLTGASKHTVLRYLELAGEACMAHHDKAVRGVKASRVECDEIWSFNYCKKANLAKAKAAPEGAGDAWTWTAIDADSKLIVSYLIGSRDADAAQDFMHDVADRLANRVQLTTDGHGAYLSAVLGAFGIDVVYAQLVKHYGPTPDSSGPERKYSPGECCGISKRRVLGKPLKALVSTSYVEKHNQTMRQHMKRFARLTAGHSKKIDNHVHMVALYTCWYNFARMNSAVRMSPAMACGLEQRLWDIGDIVKLIEEWEVAQLA
ncbi:MAG TPA: DDE-type integrase/transposase/recombinase [Rhizomicrobium sp.]|nr:DDE-type integrase/transposase/recombinase [Rhizomicrobium sp.]